MKKKPILQLALCCIMVISLIAACGCDLTTSANTDTTAPVVSSTVPIIDAGQMAINSAVIVTFSEPMNPLTISAATFILKQGETPVPGTVSCSHVSAMFVPESSLTVNTPYTVTITTGAKDYAGNALADDYIWSFQTGEVVDTVPPAVSSTIPITATSGVAINGAITVIFSEAMNPLSVTKLTFKLYQGSKPVSGTVSYSLVSAVFVPKNKLALNTVYTATITAGVKDLAGNLLEKNYTWSWTTGNNPDILAPTVSNTIQDNGEENIPINTKVGVTFSEPMDPLTITNLTLVMKKGETPVSGIVTCSGVTAVFVPAGNLAYKTVYTVEISTGVKDLAGNAMAAPFIWSFTTGKDPDIIAPMVIGTMHDDDAINIPVNTKVGAIFSEAMDPLTITNLTFTLLQGDTQVSGIITYSGVSAVFVPEENLAYNTAYTVTVTSGVKDLAGNALAAPYELSWTTGEAPDTTAPTVIMTQPVSGAVDVAVDTVITVVFSEMLDPLTVTNVFLTLKKDTIPVSGTVTYSGVTAVFKPSARLSVGVVYTGTITTNVKDLAGNTLTSNYNISFTTGIDSQAGGGRG